MAASSDLTYNLSVPRRPGLDDFNGAAKENDLEVPNPTTDPSAEEYNQLCKQAVALAKVAPMCLIEVRFNAGAPVVERVISTSDNVDASDITPTDNGDGDTSLNWAANTFPAAAVRATAAIVDDVEIDRVRAMPITNGVQVKTKLGATGTDVRFVVTIY